MNNEECKIYAVEEAGWFVNWNRVNAKQAMEDGALPFVRHGWRVMISQAAFNRLLETMSAMGDGGVQVA